VFYNVQAYGVHINGFVVDSNGKKYLWVAKRSMEKQTFPGMLDHIVAGGQVSPNFHVSSLDICSSYLIQSSSSASHVIA
jgi:hypothetical protein